MHDNAAGKARLFDACRHRSSCVRLVRTLVSRCVRAGARRRRGGLRRGARHRQFSRRKRHSGSAPASGISSTFTMQMSMIVVTGYAVATSPPVYAVIRKLAEFPTNGRNAAAYVGLFSMLASLVSWSFSLIFSGLLAREVAHRVRGADYRAIGAAAYLGVGSVWALGLSSSAALIMAAPASLPDAIERISGVIPLSQTLGLWQSMVDRRRADRGLDGHLLLLGAGRSRSARHGGDGRRHISRATQTLARARDAGRMARIQPAADDRRLRARLRLSDSRSRDQRSGDHPRAESLRVSRS